MNRPSRFALLLLLASPASALASGWEWRRQPVSAEDYAEIRRIDRLNSIPACQLYSVAESERAATNAQVLMQYNGALPYSAPLPTTPEVCVPRRGLGHALHRR